MSDNVKSTITHIKIEDIRPNPYQPRTNFDESQLNDLAKSIETHGVMQPIIVRKSIKGYTLVVGERRLRASKHANKDTIPAIVKELTDEEMMILSVIENLQRENLSVLEEAHSYKNLMDELAMTQQDVATTLGKSRPYIANIVRLLSLPKAVQTLIDKEKLSSAHGRTLLSLKNNEEMIKVAKRAVKERWSVRTLEDYVDNAVTRPVHPKKMKTTPNFIKRYEQLMKEKYGTDVEIKVVKKSGRISFTFHSEAEFKRIIEDLLE